MKKQPIVHQFTAVLSGRDAVGYHTFALDALLQKLGAQTKIYAAHISPENHNQAVPYHQHASDEAPDLIIYQSSTGTPVVDYLLTRPEPIIVNYHNMTPSRYYRGWRPELAAELELGRRQLPQLCLKASIGIADSEFNRSELRSLGLRSVEVAPVLINDNVLPSGDALTLTDVAERENRGRKNLGYESKATILFVGRLAPNKCQHELLSTLALLRRSIPNVELALVGVSAADTYEAALKDFAQTLDVAASVRFLGSMSLPDLVAWYQRADLFVCLSEHEGFCAPLVEAMAWGVPVIAYEATAVAETLNGAGLILRDKSPATVAVAVEKLLASSKLRRDIVKKGLIRAAEVGPNASRAILTKILAPMLDNQREQR